MALEYFPCYHSYRRKIAKLSDQEVGRLFRSLLEYSETGEAPELAGRESVAFDFIADDIDRAKQNYSELCDRNRENGKKKYDRLPSHATACETCQSESKTKSKSKREKESKAKRDDEDASASGAHLLEAYRSAFIEECPSLPQPSETGKWTAARKQAIRAKGMTPDEMRAVFAKVQQSDFLSGRSQKWDGCSLDWILKPANWQKIREGNYDNKSPQLSPRQPSYDLTALADIDLTQI
ncbi:DUF6291 domain-containing protein [Yeguia hominis]|uniref:DUF6291 domain-containing protein n=1 Tax=Yeguia hominis TaxID=2763662 RepID=A0A926HRF8_9FIRM|nr:DUF6291 domain-containing protein [Yeguia hominis]MBC8533193.1 hypothetical protein [Yeguia hominis]